LRGKLGALAPVPAALLPRTGPSSNGIVRPVRTRFFYGNGTVTATATALRQRIRNAGNQASVTMRQHCRAVRGVP